MRVLSTGGVVAAAMALSVVSAWAQAPAGEAVYTQNCAACHEGNLPRMPTRAALRELTPEHVETALSSFSMRRQGANLSPAARAGRIARRSTSFPRARIARLAFAMRPRHSRAPAGTAGAPTLATRATSPRPRRVSRLPTCRS
jgi:hypothetical protein